jgi:roadblock/LC7 domain-containing protein
MLHLYNIQIIAKYATLMEDLFAKAFASLAAMAWTPQPNPGGLGYRLSFRHHCTTTA